MILVKQTDNNKWQIVSGHLRAKVAISLGLPLVCRDVKTGQVFTIKTDQLKDK